MPLLAGYAAASIQERVATGPRAGLTTESTSELRVALTSPRGRS